MSESVMRVIVLGGNGFIGKELCNVLRKNPEMELLAPDSKELNLLIPEKVKNYFDKHISADTSLIISAARTPYSSVPKDDLNCMLENVVMARNIMDAIPDTCKEIIYLSTVDVYGSSSEAITEQSLVLPESNYAKAKFDAERILKDFATKRKISLLVLRLSQVFGERDNSPKLIPTLIKSAILSNEMSITGKGKTLRDFVSVSDVVNIINLSVNRKKNGIVNVATGVSVTVLKIADIIKSKINKEISVKFVLPEQKKSSMRFDNRNFKKYFDYKFSNLEGEITKCILNYELKRT